MKPSPEALSFTRSHWDSPLTPQGEQAALLLQAIVDSSDDAIISKDLNGIITSWNRAAERMFGYKPEEIVGKPITTIIPKLLWDDEPYILGKVKAGETIVHFQTTRLHKDGTPVEISLSVSPIRDRQGNIVGAAKIARDITQQKTDEQDARRLAAIVESSDDAIISKDLNGFITSWNKAAERIFGYKGEEIVGKSVLTLIPPELHKDEPIILSKIRAGQRIEHFQTVRLHKDGGRLDVSLTVSPIRDGNVIIGAAKIVRDVTKQRQLEAALHISEKLASVGRLSATIAHEINNPLEAVTNFIYLARQEPSLPANIAEYLKAADQELARVAHVAQQTLGFYRDNTHPSQIDVSSAAQQVLKVYESRLRYKGIEVEQRIAPHTMIETLSGQLKQIMLNLMANAIDASRDNGKLVISARLSTHVRPGTDLLVLTIADNGSGISKSDQLKIFEPFFTTKRDVGTGLGLWITRDLVEKKGGHIRMRSRSGSNSGTVFTVFLPVTFEQSVQEPAA